MQFVLTELAKKLGITLNPPKKGDAGHDLYACIDKPVFLYPNALPVMIPTGIHIHIANPYLAGCLLLRSSSGMKGITIPNGFGLIDSGYTGEMKLILSYSGGEDRFEILPAQKIAQLVIMPIILPELQESDSLPTTARGSNGFGSTGI